MAKINISNLLVFEALCLGIRSGGIFCFLFILKGMHMRYVMGKYSLFFLIKCQINIQIIIIIVICSSSI